MSIQTLCVTAKATGLALIAALLSVACASQTADVPPTSDATESDEYRSSRCGGAGGHCCAGTEEWFCTDPATECAYRPGQRADEAPYCQYRSSPTEEDCQWLQGVLVCQSKPGCQRLQGVEVCPPEPRCSFLQGILVCP